MAQHKSLLKGVLLATLFLIHAPCWLQLEAQGQVHGKAGQQEQKREAIQRLLTTQNAVATFNTRPVKGGRIDADHNIMRSMYRMSDAAEGTPAAPLVASEAFLREHATRLGIGADLDELRLIDNQATAYSHHITYQQFYNDLPVYQRFLKVNLNKAGQVTMVSNGYAPGLSGDDLVPSVPAGAALQTIDQALESNIARSSTAELMVWPSNPARLVWQMVVWTSDPALELEVLVDAKNGDIVHARHTSTHAHHAASHGHAGDHDHDHGGDAESVLSRFAVAADNVSAGNVSAGNVSAGNISIASFGSATGSGLVFDPDPLTTSDQVYSAPFLDNSDNDIPEVNQERVLVDLLDISQGADGLYRLVGPHVEVVGETAGGTLNYTIPAESDPNGFQYTRSDDFFEAVNVYYHIDKSQRYIQSLNVGRDIQNVSIEVNPHGLGSEDNSRYFSIQNFIAFGEGGVDDAEDAHVIWHEYGHAILQGSAPNLLNTLEGQALHEGWADYWAASYARRLAEANADTRSDWRALFKWDSGDGAIWSGRQVEVTGTYPQDVFCDDGGFQCDIYDDGLFWATTLMEIYDEYGAEVTDRLALASHIYLSSPVSLRDAAEAMLQADLDLYDGTHYDTLLQLFISKGLVSSTTQGPVVLHTPLTIVEQLGGEIPISVEAFGVSSPVETVAIVYTHPGEAADTLMLMPVGDDLYSGMLPLPDSPGEVRYFIEVTDQFGLFVKAPDQRVVPSYTFTVGPDTVPPVIAHTQQTAISLADWPAEIRANVDDNLGVDTVYVEYYVDGPFGERVAEGDVGLAPVGNTEYVAELPVAVDVIQPGSTVFYRIIAQDAAQAGNTVALPESGFLGFNIIIEDGLFRFYDFENALPGFAATGLWQQGAPGYGTRIAFSGDSLWATNPAGAYPDAAQLSSFTLPPMNLRGIETAYLVFWHWFDTEDAGEAQPDGDDSARLWDGGNVKVSSDNGTTWEVLVPEAGYNGRIASARDNPLEGELAFGGFSYGWRQVVFSLPAGQTVQLRFDFGTDSGNTGASAAYAGWYIDDVRILTELPVDVEHPGMNGVLLPENVITREMGQDIPEPFVEITDNVGIESVFVDYTVSNGGTTIDEGRTRLAMDSTRLDAFRGTFPFQASTIRVGDVVDYRFIVTDFSGNSVSYPEVNGNAFRIEYRLIDQLNLISQASLTGLWQMEQDTLVLRRRDAHEEISSVVFGPYDLPLNVDNIFVNLTYTHDITSGKGGNLKLSSDEANQWVFIDPLEGYDGVLPNTDAIPEAMRNEGVFTGLVRSPRTVTFDLFAYAGEQVWLRLDFASLDELSTRVFWQIHEVSIQYSTLEPVDGGFDTPLSFALYDNFPDPFSSTTTISYTLEAASPVSLEVYDMLGRRVESLVQQDQAAGTYNVLYTASSLASGVYLLRLVTNQGQLIERMVVSK